MYESYAIRAVTLTMYTLLLLCKRVVDSGRVAITVGPHAEGGVKFVRWRDLEVKVPHVYIYNIYKQLRQRPVRFPGRIPLGPGLYILTAISPVRAVSRAFFCEICLFNCLFKSLILCWLLLLFLMFEMTNEKIIVVRQ